MSFRTYRPRMDMECYYCRLATDDIQACVYHVVSEHGDKVLKIGTKALTDQTGAYGMNDNKKILVSYQTRKYMLPGHKIIVNKEDWTLAISCHDISKNKYCETMADLERSMQTMSIDAQSDAGVH